MRTRIKICGITRPADAEVAALAGADAIGLVFYRASRRAVSVQAASEVIAALPPFVSTVALFVDPAVEDVRAVIDALRPDLLQFHGAEDEDFCLQFGVPYLKALRLGGPDPAEPSCHPLSRALLLDRFDPAQHGGTGEVFDWRLAKDFSARTVVVAGGLRPDNVERAIRELAPYGVDVSSGVESEPGRKDRHRIEEFIRAVRRADAAREAAEERR